MSSKRHEKSSSTKDNHKLEPKLFPALKNTSNGSFYGYINLAGKMIIYPKFSRAYDFNSENLAIVYYNNKAGLINTEGEFVLTPIYDEINDFKEMRAIFNMDNYMGVMNEKGKILTKKKYSFISDYSNEMALVSNISSDYSSKYGYIDMDGNEVISPQYLSADNFKEDSALVKLNNNLYALIDKKGHVVQSYNYPYVALYGDGLMVFSNTLEGPYGFINKKGNVVIKPTFTEAQGFKNNMAIVSESSDFNGPYGVIDLTGKYIFQPLFSDIKILGEDRVALGMGIGEDKYAQRSIYAIGDNKGNILSPFIYLEVGNFENGLSYVSDNEYTFFIDKSGSQVRSLPSVTGSGTLSLKNNIIYANIDYSPYYLDKAGKIIYKPNDVIPLSQNYSVLKEKYKPNINYLIYYPSIYGMKNRKSQNSVNIKFKKMSYFIPYGKDGNPQDSLISKTDVLDYDYTGNFDIQYYKKDLLILNMMGYYYPLGAAHGMPSMKTPSIDLVTGKFYTLGDLFMGGVYWTSELDKIIEKIIETDPEYSYVFKGSFKGINMNQDFYVDDNNLYIYFPPYEIGPYSAGFITFKIPFAQINNMINKKGDFYNSFHY